jgi:hypothetical protein
MTFNWVACSDELRRCANDAALSAVTLAAGSDTTWRTEWHRSIAYSHWAFHLNFLFHSTALRQFERGSRQQRLALIPFGEVAWVMANCWLLGWRDAGLRMFGWITRGLDDCFFIDAGTYGTRRAHYFCLRLISSYLGREDSRVWPSFASDEPIYRDLLERWCAADPTLLELPVLAACDRHTHQAGPDTNKTFRDFNSYPQMYQPFEVLLLMRLRQWKGLAVPVVEHPLLATPLGKLNEEVPEYSDELLRRVMERAEEERPKE